jgi:hypothetical protein
MTYSDFKELAAILSAILKKNIYGDFRGFLLCHFLYPKVLKSVEKPFVAICLG